MIDWTTIVLSGVTGIGGALIAARATNGATRNAAELQAQQVGRERDRRRSDLLKELLAELDINRRMETASRLLTVARRPYALVLFEMDSMLAATSAITSLDEAVRRDVIEARFEMHRYNVAAEACNRKDVGNSAFDQTVVLADGAKAAVSLAWGSLDADLNRPKMG